MFIGERGKIDGLRKQFVATRQRAVGPLFNEIQLSHFFVRANLHRKPRSFMEAGFTTLDFTPGPDNRARRVQEYVILKMYSPLLKHILFEAVTMFFFSILLQ